MITRERLIIQHLIQNQDFCRHTIPHVRKEYFRDAGEAIVFGIVQDFFAKYNTLPTKDAIILSIDKMETIKESEFNSAMEVIEEVTEVPEKHDARWLETTAEDFCKARAIHNAILQAIHIIEGKDKTRSQDALPSLLQEALSVSFDKRVGHDYIEDAEQRFDFYHTVEQRIPTDLKFINKITRGGLPRKTLNVVMGGPGAGKTMFMCHISAGCLRSGYNVLYITCEMAAERIAERIDANMMNVPIEKLATMEKSVFDHNMANIKTKYKGRLIVKEYPTASANANHFRALLDDLKGKKNFIPDLIVVDYLNICTSTRIKRGNGVNSYDYSKAIAEELRGLAGEMDAALLTGSQFNREGAGSSDPTMSNTAESFGVPMTADFQIALIVNEQLIADGKVLCKQFKNRYSDFTVDNKFVLGVEREKMRFIDCDDQGFISDAKQSEDAGEEDELKSKFATKRDPMWGSKSKKQNAVDDWKFEE